MKSGAIKAAIEIPPGFGRDIKRGRPVWVGAWVDGAMPFRAETIRGYLQGMHALYLADPGGERRPSSPAAARRHRTRFKYNQDFDSIYAMVPSQTCRCCSGCSPRS
jgi:ribosome-dependent ATPase